MDLKQRILEFYQFCMESRLDASLNLWTKEGDEFFSFSNAKLCTVSALIKMDSEKTTIPNAKT